MRGRGHHNHERASFSIVLEGCELLVRSEGRVQFSPDEREIESLGIRSWFEIEERAELNRRRASFEERDGELIRRWYENGNEQAWDEVAEQWLASVLVVMFRNSSYGARERAHRLYTRGGTRDVLAEAKMTYAPTALQHLYLVVIRRDKALDPSQAVEIAKGAERIDSPSSRAKVLEALLARAGGDERVLLAVAASSRSMRSPTSKSKVLKTVALAAPLTSRVGEAVVDAAVSIASPSSLGQVLRTVGQQLPDEVALPHNYVRAATAISSPSELARVLLALVERDTLAPDRVLSVLEVSEDISSNSSRGRVLRAVGGHGLDKNSRPAFFRSLAGLTSPSEQARTLMDLVSRHDDPPTLLAAVRSAEKITSSSSQAQVLVRIASVSDLEEIRNAVGRAAENITSPSARRRVRRALEDQKR